MPSSASWFSRGRLPSPHRRACLSAASREGTRWRPGWSVKRGGLALRRRACTNAAKRGGCEHARDQPRADVDVTKEWRATQGQKSAATRLRIFAAIAWIIAIGGEIAGIVLLRQHTFDHGNLALLIGLLVVIAIFAIAGSLLWKAANKQDPARESDTAHVLLPEPARRDHHADRLPAADCPDLHGQGHGPQEQEDRRRRRRRSGGRRDADRRRASTRRRSSSTPRT